MDYKKELSKLLTVEGMTAQEVYDALTSPKDSKNGDFTFACFRLAKQYRTAPVQIAQRLAESVPSSPLLSKVEAVAGYVNFTLDKDYYISTTLNEVLEKGARYGASDEGEGKTVCIDYSSINIAKPFHIGHLSTTVIGAALYRIYNFLGYKAVGINHLGDWGTQFGKLIVAFKKWGDEQTVNEGGVRAMLSLYVRFHTEAEANEELNDEARLWFKRIEDGDEEAKRLFNWFKQLTLKEVQRVYDRLGISFDSYAGESFYNDKMEPVINLLREKGLLTVSDGAEVVELEGMPPCLIRKKDGASLYATRDIAAAFYRKQTYDFYKSLYVVAYQQNLHFKQWFKVVEMMGMPWAADLQHIAFGMVSLEGSSLSTRHGHVVFLEEVLQRSVDKALEIITAKSAALENKAQVAEQVGVGAVVFSALINNRIKDIVFSFDKVLNFEGETGPYTQYTHARACSILRKADIGENKDYSSLHSDAAMELIRYLSRFGQVVSESALRAEPSMVTRYVVDLCQLFNRFYIDHRIIGEDEGVQNARLTLVAAVRQVIANGLGLIGISAPEAM